MCAQTVQRELAASLEVQAQQLVAHFQPLLEADPSLKAPDLASPASPLAAPEEASQDLAHRLDLVQQTGEDLVEARRRHQQLVEQENPFTQQVLALEAIWEEEEKFVRSRSEATTRSQTEAGLLKDLDLAFGRTGIQSFALEGILNELQTRTAYFLEQLSPAMTLLLSASRPASGPRHKESGPVERVTKSVRVVLGSGLVRERSVRQLSGGERRKVALALALGFADLIAARGCLSCNLLVLDEVFQQLDEEACSRLAKLLKKLPHSNILVVGQAGSYVTQVQKRIVRTFPKPQILATKLSVLVSYGWGAGSSASPDSVFK